jgi:hypothetical protein
MGVLNMAVLPKILEQGGEYNDRIAGWLEKLEIKSPETDESKSSEVAPLETQALRPITPPQRADPRPTYLDEVSPTDTSFSGQSVFDVPYRRNLCGSPTPKCEIRNDDSDTTSVDSHHWALMQAKENSLEQFIPPAFALRPRAPPASADYPETDSDTNTGELTAVPNGDPQPSLSIPNPNEPRPVSIMSCLQCTLAGLPCSRTYPSCSRCRRHNRAEDCLLQRRCFTSEALDPSMMERSKAPTLLKVKGDGEAIWKRKVELAQELCEKWVMEQDKKNWVLPDISSPRGGWRKRKGRIEKEKVPHPGEGIGRLSFRELFVDMDI